MIIFQFTKILFRPNNQYLICSDKQKLKEPHSYESTTLTTGLKHYGVIHKIPEGYFDLQRNFTVESHVTKHT